MNSTLLKISRALLITFLCLSVTYSHAGHILGTRITYTYVTTNTYNVKVSFYRDCQGLPAGQNATLCYSSASANLSGTVQLSSITPPVVMPNFPYFPPMVNSCNGGPGLGIERVTYEGNVVLPASASDWILSYSTFPQNVGINQNFMYVSTRIDNLNYPVNSSISYVTDPTFAFCVNQPAWDNFACTDSDGDSLSYHLIPILDNTTVCPPAPFQNPLQPFNPLTSSTPITMDSINGSLTFTPTTVGQAMVSARVDEFRNGVLINSSTVEHVMYLVTGCIISGVDEMNTTDLNLYPNPVRENLILEFTGNENPLYVEATDLSGKISKLNFTTSTTGRFVVDVEMLSGGIYMLRVVTASGMELRRFVKM